jgi:hypothetical protein
MEEKKTSRRPARPPKDANTVRERTLAHLENVMRAAITTVGTGILIASSAQGQERQCPVVVDPPPPPSGDCCEKPEQLLSRCVDAQAGWVKVKGQWNLRLSVLSWGSRSISFDGLGKADILASGVSVKELQVSGYDLTLVLAPAGGAKTAVVQIPVKCGAKKLTLKLAVDFTEEPGENCYAIVRQVK